ncbi:hypothetical protein, partial [Pseudomonas mandelii]|uniref:hypothetical protein n=1 Tax=Pseudomonas mandelii TaxID=75612 RepID=UPI00224AD740
AAKGRVEHGLGGAFAGDELAVDQEFGLHRFVLFEPVVLLSSSIPCGSHDSLWEQGLPAMASS